MARSWLPSLILLIVATSVALATARGNRKGLALVAAPPPPDLEAAALYNDTFNLPPEEAPGSPTQNCLNRLTYDCAKSVDQALVSRKTDNITDLCCKKVMLIGKTCWTLLIYTKADDPCRYLSQVIKKCSTVTNQKPFAIHDGVDSCYSQKQEDKLIADAEDYV